jgi:hypothetical protein
MSFTVRELPKAKQDKHSIFRWLYVDRRPAPWHGSMLTTLVLMDCVTGLRHLVKHLKTATATSKYVSRSSRLRAVESIACCI